MSVSFYTQRLRVSSDLLSVDRKVALASLCRGLRVIHVGCVGTTVSGPQHHLHRMLDSVCTDLVGVDSNEAGLRALRSLLVHQELYRSPDLVPRRPFDVLLLPEVLEHVDNVQSFLSSMQGLIFDTAIVTVPCAFLASQRPQFRYEPVSGAFTELVHPDHNAWYSPYTLSRTIERFTPWRVRSLHFLDGISVMAVAENSL